MVCYKSGLVAQQHNRERLRQNIWFRRNDFIGLKAGTKCSSYYLEIAGSNPEDATAIHGQMLKRAKLACAMPISQLYWH